MNDLLKKLQQLKNEQDLVADERLVKDLDKAQFEMENMSNARFYPGRIGAAKPELTEKGYYLGGEDKEAVENSPSYQFMKLKSLLEKRK